MRLLVLFSVFIIVNCDVTRFRVIKQWKYVNFTWPSEEIYSESIARGEYIPENNIIAGIKYFNNNYYITLPRMRSGVPVTLARISSESNTGTSPPLEPYPSWEQNRVGDCSALQNVQNVEVDSAGLLWIIDGGRVQTLDPKPITKCPPKLLVHDLKSNRTVSRFEFPDQVASINGSFLYDLVVDDTNGGYAYITDNGGKDPGIIVYSIKENRSWKIRHSETMRADPQAVHFHVGDVQVAAALNIASIALGPKLKQFSNDNVILSDVRDVYYCPISSMHLYSLNTTVLRNELLANTEYQGDVKDYGIKASQTVGMIMDNEGNLYYSLLATNSIAKWNIHTSFQSGQKVIAQDDMFLEWPNSYTFVDNGNLTVLVNRLDRFIYGTLKLSENNFYLVNAHVGGKSYVFDDDYRYNVNETQAELPISGEKEQRLEPVVPAEPRNPPQMGSTTEMPLFRTTSSSSTPAMVTRMSVQSAGNRAFITVPCLLTVLFVKLLKL